MDGTSRPSKFGGDEDDEAVVAEGVEFVGLGDSGGIEFGRFCGRVGSGGGSLFTGWEVGVDEEAASVIV